MEPFLLVHSPDNPDESQQFGYDDFDNAARDGIKLSVADTNGPAWGAWSVWGNNPETETWEPLLCSIHELL